MIFRYNPNIYLADIPDFAANTAIAHAMEMFPNESCGAVVDGQYRRFTNVAEHSADEFIIDDPAWFELYMTGEIECLVHSHNNFNKASVLDQSQQQELEIPSMIINLHQGSLKDCIVFGTKNTAPLEGRPFFYGAFDCLALVHDYLLQENGIDLPNPPHEWEFWARAENPVETMLDTNKDIPFREVTATRLQKGDVLLYNMFGTKWINHMAVVCSDRGEILHHLYNNVSGRYPASYGRKYLRKVMRQK